MSYEKNWDPLSLKSIFIGAIVVLWRQVYSKKYKKSTFSLHIGLYHIGILNRFQPHFHILHRLMHPWRVSFLPDFGRFLYRQVHALHHSFNPTAFSGTNMHPVESTLYYTAGFVPVLWQLGMENAVKLKPKNLLYARDNL